MILAIPVRVEHEDFLAWYHNVKGIFSMKSTYHVLKHAQDNRGKKQVGESLARASENLYSG